MSPSPFNIKWYFFQSMELKFQFNEFSNKTWSRTSYRNAADDWFADIPDNDAIDTISTVNKDLILREALEMTFTAGGY